MFVYEEVPGQSGRWTRTDYSSLVNTPIGQMDAAAVKIDVAGGDVDLKSLGMDGLDPAMQARIREGLKDMRSSTDISMEYFDFGVATQEPAASQVTARSPVAPR